jgi:HSP20 family protein
MPMDAWREGDRFIVEFDLPGVTRIPDLNARAQCAHGHFRRPDLDPNREMVSA